MILRLGAIFVLLSAFSLTAPGAGYVKFDGVDGESQVAGHAGESDVLSWSWGIAREEGGGTGSTRRRGAAVVDDLVITKELDKASVKILEACLQGRIFPKVTLTLEQSSAAGAAFTYLVIEMTGVAVASFSTAGESGGGRPTESIALNFDEVKVTYSLQKPDGTSGGNVETTWQIEEGTP
jgi:type VI secretion system secreted protein Hcp